MIATAVTYNDGRYNGALIGYYPRGKLSQIEGNIE
jgi:antitoxin component YwqK of YwqJK toxin-antitoxin module